LEYKKLKIIHQYCEIYFTPRDAITGGLAEILGLASIAVFPALLPIFQVEWNLNNTAAGWISAAYYAGYMVLDFFGGGQTGWTMAFVTMAAGCLLGPIFLTQAAHEQ
jgi:hypothetical protein